MVRSALRTSTTSLHAAIDARFSQMLETGEAGYRNFLAASAAAVFPLEAALCAGEVNRIIPDWPARSRTAALRADLDDLGIDVPTYRCIPRLESEAHCLGVLYVLEGSRLGAKLVARRLSATVDHRARAAMRYLTHGQGCRLWESFLARLESAAATQSSGDHVLAGARMAFARFCAPALTEEDPAMLAAGGSHAG
jgi:heme oxygenase